MHACPWDVSQRVALASAALRSGPARAPAAARLCSDPRLDRLAPPRGVSLAGVTERETQRRRTSSQVNFHRNPGVGEALVLQAPFGSP